MTRRIIWGLIILAVVVAGVPYLPASLFQPAIIRALERSLGRKVEVGEVHLSLFGMPGFTVDDVTIHEDPRAGIEPFAYVPSLGADVNLFALLRRKLEFSTIRISGSPELGDPSINLVKTDAGPWNFQFLLDSPAAAQGSIPVIKMRTGRVNFKFGDTKSLFYFYDADLTVSPGSDGSVEIRFGGAPARTDRSAQTFGHFFVRGNWSPGDQHGREQRFNLNVELERSSLDEVLKLADTNGFNLHGNVAMEAQITGPASDLDVTGDFQLDELHRGDLPPQKEAAWRQRYMGTLDLRTERLTLKTVSESPKPPVIIEFNASDYLTVPKWRVSAGFYEMPLTKLVEVARQLGTPLPDTLTAEGALSGSVTYTLKDGFGGDLDVGSASLVLPEIPPLRAESLQVSVKDGAVRLEPAMIQVGEDNAAQVEASYSFTPEVHKEGGKEVVQPGGFDLKLSTHGMSVADTRSFGLKAIPLLEHTPQGTWRGWARYHAGDWTGEYELLNAKVAVDGLAEPLLIQSTAVSLTGNRAIANRLKAKIGAISFTGDYRWEPTAPRPHKFHLNVPQADLAELNRLFAPALVRQSGFLETLRIGSTTLPAWLKDRRAEGTVSIEALMVGDKTVHVDPTRVVWDEAKVRFEDFEASLEDSPVTGTLSIDLEGRAPQYHFQGLLEEFPYKGGTVDFEGTADAEGSGLQLLATARAEGTFRARSVSFTPDADFRTATGHFDFKNAIWKLANIEIVQGSDSLTGAGASQPDGRLVLDLLTGRNRPVRYSGTLLASGQP
jgi:hypothetical protein